MITKISVLVLSFSLFFSMVNGQDTITMKNGLTLYGLITEVNNSEIKFRIDGGTISLDQIKSYQQGGRLKVLSNNTPSQTQPTKTNPPQDCEIKNVGDVQFENKLSENRTVIIYAIGVVPESTGSRTTNNPEVTRISVPPNSTVTVYELTTGVHFFESREYANSIGGNDRTGQIRITKCGVAKYSITN